MTLAPCFVFVSYHLQVTYHIYLVCLFVALQPSEPLILSSEISTFEMSDGGSDEGPLSNLNFIINHVFFPPQLPQKSDVNTERNVSLCKTLVELAEEVCFPPVMSLLEH